MMIMKMFPKKLPSKIEHNAQSLEILSAFESTKIHDVKFCWPSAVSFPIKVMVVLFLNGIMRCFAFQKRAVGAGAKRIHP